MPAQSNEIGIADEAARPLWLRPDLIMARWACRRSIHRQGCRI